MKGKIKARKHESLRGLLVKGYLEKVSSKLFELIKDKLNELLKGQSGIYVLYKNNTIYYIGLAKNLRGRNRVETLHKSFRRPEAIPAGL